MKVARPVSWEGVGKVPAKATRRLPTRPEKYLSGQLAGPLPNFRHPATKRQILHARVASFLQRMAKGASTPQRSGCNFRPSHRGAGHFRCASTAAGLVCDRRGHRAVDAQQVEDGLWRTAAHATFGGNAKVGESPLHCGNATLGALPLRSRLPHANTLRGAYLAPKRIGKASVQPWGAVTCPTSMM